MKAKRKNILRELVAGSLPGKSPVVYDPVLRIPIDVFPCENGHALECSLFGDVLATVEVNDVWTANRNFSTCGFITAIFETPIAVTDASGKKHIFRRIRVYLKTETRDSDKEIFIITEISAKFRKGEPSEISPGQEKNTIQVKCLIKNRAMESEIHGSRPAWKMAGGRSMGR
ncbi:hypothetical protein QUF90_00280 [Desulfococcaceae bacterium HSG9]|nr:hypothetical protein [Desulfococcaceae bacterium HSG9]